MFVLTGTHCSTMHTFTLDKFNFTLIVMCQAPPPPLLSPLLKYASLSVGGRIIKALTFMTYSPFLSGHYTLVSWQGTAWEAQTPALTLIDRIKS